MNGKLLVLILLAMLAYLAYACIRPRFPRGIWGRALAVTSVSVMFAFGLAFDLACVAVAKAEGIPHVASQHKHTLTQQAHYAWGLDAPVATFAAQIQQESRWRSDAASAVGAHGLAQFMPSTERWIKSVTPALNTAPRVDEGAMGSMAPWGSANPVWSMRALVTYDRWLWDRTAASSDCDHMAMVLSSYNGGLGWLIRDRSRAPAALRAQWFNGVERYNAGRSNAAFNENRTYPRLILLKWEPLYRTAGWGMGVCA